MSARHLAGSVLCLVVLTACTPQRSGGLIEDVQQDARSVQYNQIRIQLARSYEHPYDVPSLVLLSTANAASNNSLKASFSRASAPGGLTHTAGFDFGAFTDNTQLIVNVTSGATAIQGMRDLYAYASNGDPSWETSIGGSLINKPPAYRWLFRSSGSAPAECNPASCYKITKIAESTYWARTEKDFSDFVLSILEASSFTRDNAPAIPVVNAKSGKRKYVPTGIKRFEPNNSAPTILVIPSGGATN